MDLGLTWIVLRSIHEICLLWKSVTCLDRSQFQRHSSVHIPIAFISTLPTQHTTRFICFWLRSISDWSQFVLERSHSDRFWVKSISDPFRSLVTVWIGAAHTHQCEHSAYKHSLIASSFSHILRFKFSIKNLTGNIQKLSTRRFRQYLNEASDVLNLVIFSDFLLEVSVNSLSLWPDNCSQVDTELVFLGYNNNLTKTNCF